MQIEKKHVGKT